MNEYWHHTFELQSLIVSKELLTVVIGTEYTHLVQSVFSYFIIVVYFSLQHSCEFVSFFEGF